MLHDAMKAVVNAPTPACDRDVGARDRRPRRRLVRRLMRRLAPLLVLGCATALRGHGRSVTPPGPFAIDDPVDDLRIALYSAGIRRAPLVRYSFAGNEITRFAERLPAGVMGSLGTIATTYHRAYGTLRMPVPFIYGEFRVAPATFEGDSAKSPMLREWEARDFRRRQVAKRAHCATTAEPPRRDNSGGAHTSLPLVGRDRIVAEIQRLVEMERRRSNSRLPSWPRSQRVPRV